MRVVGEVHLVDADSGVVMVMSAGLGAEDPRIVVPEAADVERRLEEILDRGSVNLGEQAGIERLMLMVTRSCELRCGYCFVNKTEAGLEMPVSRALRGVDLIMKSDRPKLEVQFFGGEPSRCWDVLSEVLEYTMTHPLRHGRRVEFVLTTNGTGLDAERVAHLERYPVMVLFSLDGDAASHRRFRQSHLVSDEEAYAAILETVRLLSESSLNWFMNATIPPAGAAETYDRYLWALEHGIPRLQLNYAVGMYWRPHQERAYLTQLQRVLLDHAEDPERLMLFNWRSDCEPTILSDDLIVDTDGVVLHDAAIFLERSLPKLKDTYRRGELDGLEEFDALRWNLATLAKVLRTTYDPGTRQHRIVEQNLRMGAAVDLVIQQMIEGLGGAPGQETARGALERGEGHAVMGQPVEVIGGRAGPDGFGPPDHDRR